MQQKINLTVNIQICPLKAKGMSDTIYFQPVQTETLSGNSTSIS